MGSFWWGGMVIAIIAVTFSGIVQIIKVSKTASGSKKLLERIDSLETDLGESGQFMEDAVARIEVLERIVTDDKYSLGEEIDSLAGRRG